MFLYWHGMNLLETLQCIEFIECLISEPIGMVWEHWLTRQDANRLTVVDRWDRFEPFTGHREAPVSSLQISSFSAGRFKICEDASGGCWLSSGTECKSRVSRRWVGVYDGPHGARLLSTSTVAWQDEMNIIWWFGNYMDSGLKICLLHFLFLPHTGLFWKFVVAFHFSWHTRHVNVDSFHLWSRKSIQSALAAVADERRSTA